jgi:rubrerythrin
MPDEDRVVAAIMDLTNQVARAAWAMEVRTRMELEKGSFESDPCPKCGCMIIPVQAEACPACLEPKKESHDD